MLDADSPGFEELREQARTARVMRRCSCGCPSIDLAVDRAQHSSCPRDGRRGVVVSAPSRDPRFTHLLLWIDGGYLAGLELSWLDEYPDEFPPPATFDPPGSG
jgi:hypothetical protein